QEPQPDGREHRREADPDERAVAPQRAFERGQWRTTPCVLQWICATCAWVSLKGRSISPSVLHDPVTNSASVNSKPSGRLIRTRCGAPVTGFAIGCASASISFGIETDAEPRSMLI